jgi:hypothetical protein
MHRDMAYRIKRNSDIPCTKNMKHTELRNGNKRDVMHRNNVENI